MKPFLINLEDYHFIVTYNKSIVDSIYIGETNAYPHALLTIYNRDVFIEKIFIPENLRNHNLGTDILRYIIDISIKRNYKKIELSISSAYGSDLLRLAEFYSRIGFIQYGTLFVLNLNKEN